MIKLKNQLNEFIAERKGYVIVALKLLKFTATQLFFVIFSIFSNTNLLFV